MTEVGRVASTVAGVVGAAQIGVSVAHTVEKVHGTVQVGVWKVAHIVETV